MRDVCTGLASGAAAAMARGMGENPVIQAGLRLISESGDELLPHAELAQYSGWTGGTMRLLERASELGELRPGLDLEAAAETVTILFRGAFDPSSFLEVDTTFADRLERAWSILLPGLLADADPARVSALLAAAFRR